MATALLLLLVGPLVAGSVWMVEAIRAVSPLTGPGDVLALVHPGDPQPGSLAWKVNANDRVNVLLMAYGGAGGDNPDYTDTMLVVSIRPKTHQATVISLPRYLWVRIPAPQNGDVEGKLYAAFALGESADPSFLRPRWRSPTGAGDLAAATVAATIAQPIDYWIAVTNDAFAALIDALGGIRITIPELLDDDRYPSANGAGTVHVHFDPGPQTLNGERALQYARSRRSTSEADRSRRQELVLAALIERVRSPRPGPADVFALGPLAGGLRTDLRPLEIQELHKLAGALHASDIKDVTLDGSPYLVSKTIGPDTEVLIPQDGSFAAIQAFIARQLP